MILYASYKGPNIKLKPVNWFPRCYKCKHRYSK